MIRPSTHLKTIQDKRQWLESALPLPGDILDSLAYRTLTYETKIILMLMMDREWGGSRARS